MNQVDAHIRNDKNINVALKMGSLRRASKEKDTLGRFKGNSPCKKHPKHRQSPGVCSLCLRDKLSQLPAASYSSRTSTHSSSASSSLSSYYSSSASSSASPFLFSAKQSGVLKSKSMSVVATRTRTRTRDGDAADNNKTHKKRGFWSKLLHPKTKINATKLVHTRSLIETMT